MAAEFTNILSTDIYKSAELIENLKKKYTNINEDTLFLGVFGYLQSVFQNAMQNTATMVTDYANEAIPTRAKFHKNLMAHALALGINNIMARPAETNIMLAFSEESLKQNMHNSKSGKEVIIDKDCIFTIGEDKKYEYLLDYDVIIRQIELPTGDFAYTARYDIGEYNTNPLSGVTNPYLPALARIAVNEDKLVALSVKVRQMKHDRIYKNVVVENPLETKTIIFEYTDQLAYFYVEVEEKTADDSATTYHYLEPIYEGIYDFETTNEYINYMYIDNKTIRLKFNRESYMPRNNAEITVHVYTTLGDECNFSISNTYQSIGVLKSSNYIYNNFYYLLRSIDDSQFGRNIYTIDTLKKVIPREALARGSITTYTDLINYFNLLQDEDCKLYVLRKVHNQMERIYFCYLLLKDKDNIIPTNTCTVSFNRSIFLSVSQNNYIIQDGNVFYQNLTKDKIATAINNFEKVIEEQIDDKTLEDYDNTGFVYINPFLMVINKTPFYISYYNTYVNYIKQLYADYINTDSDLQFVAQAVYVYKNYFITDENNKIVRNTNNDLHIQVTTTQNINVDYDLIDYNLDKEISDSRVVAYIVLYNPDDNGDYTVPYRYCKGTLQEFQKGQSNYIFDFVLYSNNKFADKNNYMYFTKGLQAIGTGKELPGYLRPTMGMKLFITVKMDKEYGKDRGKTYMFDDGTEGSINDLFPEKDIEGYTLTNIYGLGRAGIDLYYDYSDYMNSYVTFGTNENGKISYFTAVKTPLVRYKWWCNEDRVKYFFKLFDYRRRFIEEAIILLENSFGVDYKFFNTYGKSQFYNIENEENIDRINLSLKFEIGLKTKEDESILPALKTSIKEYIEDINEITDLHISNLITYITNLYESYLRYFKFIKLNNYDSLHQSIYKNPELDSSYFMETQIVPEFINVNTIINEEGKEEPDIIFDIKY